SRSTLLRPYFAKYKFRLSIPLSMFFLKHLSRTALRTGLEGTDNYVAHNTTSRTAKHMSETTNPDCRSFLSFPSLTTSRCVAALM
ncbi:hypothetical protein HPB47_004678, partial [Ixodes persulcatus]